MTTNIKTNQIFTEAIRRLSGMDSVPSIYVEIARFVASGGEDGKPRSGFGSIGTTFGARMTFDESDHSDSHEVAKLFRWLVIASNTGHEAIISELMRNTLHDVRDCVPCTDAFLFTYVGENMREPGGETKATETHIRLVDYIYENGGSVDRDATHEHFGSDLKFSPTGYADEAHQLQAHGILVFNPGGTTYELSEETKHAFEELRQEQDSRLNALIGEPLANAVLDALMRDDPLVWTPGETDPTLYLARQLYRKPAEGYSLNDIRVMFDDMVSYANAMIEMPDELTKLMDAKIVVDAEGRFKISRDMKDLMDRELDRRTRHFSFGKSAYEVAVDNGFMGTHEQWLLSLKGPTEVEWDLNSVDIEKLLHLTVNYKVVEWVSKIIHHTPQDPNLDEPQLRILRTMHDNNRRMSRDVLADRLGLRDIPIVSASGRALTNLEMIGAIDFNLDDEEYYLSPEMLIVFDAWAKDKFEKLKEGIAIIATNKFNQVHQDAREVTLAEQQGNLDALLNIAKVDKARVSQMLDLPLVKELSNLVAKDFQTTVNDPLTHRLVRYLVQNRRSGRGSVLVSSELTGMFGDKTFKLVEGQMHASIAPLRRQWIIDYNGNVMDLSDEFWLICEAKRQDHMVWLSEQLVGVEDEVPASDKVYFPARDDRLPEAAACAMPAEDEAILKATYHYRGKDLTYAQVHDTYAKLRGFLASPWTKELEDFKILLNGMAYDKVMAQRCVDVIERAGFAVYQQH